MTVYADRAPTVDRSRGQQPHAGVIGTSGFAASAAGRQHAGTLLVLDGPDRGRAWRLSPGSYLLGRTANSDLPVTDPWVARRQCVLAVADHPSDQPGSVTVEDLPSSSGTLVDGVWAKRPTTLRPGTMIVVGGSTLGWTPDGWRPPTSSASTAPTVDGARPRPPQHEPRHPSARPALSAAPPRRAHVPVPVRVPAPVPASVAGAHTPPPAPAAAPEPPTGLVLAPRKIRWPRSAAPERPASTSTVLSTLTTLCGLGALAAIGMLTGLPLLFPPLAGSLALIAAGTALPLAQPRNVIGGHVVSALVAFAAVGLIGPGGWAAALAGAGALGAMLVLRVSHSPAVATAVIVGATGPSAPVFLELLVLAAVITVAFGIVGAKLDGKKYPVYWW
jgi:hypothetical protein